MDKRKLIGTIIGVTMFAALIAGATFAWLTFTANVTNGTYNTKTEDFVINYTGGTSITEMLDIIAAPTRSNVSKSVKVSAYRTSTSSTGTLYIKLNTTSTSNTLLTSGAIRYAVCSGTSSAANCTSTLASGQTGILSAGSITATGNTTLYSTTSIPTTQTYYWIYFWMDAETLVNSHLGQTYSGYIHASATQS